MKVELYEKVAGGDIRSTGLETGWKPVLFKSRKKLYFSKQPITQLIDYQTGGIVSDLPENIDILGKAIDKAISKMIASN